LSFELLFEIRIFIMMDLFEYLKTLQKMRVKQLRQAVFVDLVGSVDEITTFSKDGRELMAQKFDLLPFSVEKESKSKDGSVKLLLKTHDNNFVEVVILKFRDGRNTVCISSQVGCPVKCAFCATGKLGLKRNLTVWEIISQVLLAARYLKKQETRNNDQISNNKTIKQYSNDKITNIVFMGMGEPLLNLDNVLLAIEELTSPEGFGLGARHITVSTCGPIEQLKKFIAKKTRTTLAISLHASDQKMREKLMPIAKANPLSDLMVVLDEYVAETNKRVSYEYIMLRGVNDSESQARQLFYLLKGKLSHVNLISYNDVEGSNFKPSSREQIDKFAAILKEVKVNVTTRVSLGDNIDAACGQLAGKSSNSNL